MTPGQNKLKMSSGGKLYSCLLISSSETLTYIPPKRTFLQSPHENFVISFVSSLAQQKNSKEYRKHSSAQAVSIILTIRVKIKKKVFKNFGQPLLHQGNEDAEIVDSIIKT